MFLCLLPLDPHTAGTEIQHVPRKTVKKAWSNLVKEAWPVYPSATMKGVYFENLFSWLLLLLFLHCRCYSSCVREENNHVEVES